MEDHRRIDPLLGSWRPRVRGVAVTDEPIEVIAELKSLLDRIWRSRKRR